MSDPADVLVDIAAEHIIAAIRETIETLRDEQLDGAQCDARADYRAGWIAACERLLDGLTTEEDDDG